MQRVVILGRGASGKSTIARALGRVTNLPVLEDVKLLVFRDARATEHFTEGIKQNRPSLS
jgi:adenylate kinase family enzyme